MLKNKILSRRNFLKTLQIKNVAEMNISIGRLMKLKKTSFKLQQEDIKMESGREQKTERRTKDVKHPSRCCIKTGRRK